MFARTASYLVLVSIAALIVAAPAGAAEQTATRGAVTATLTFDEPEEYQAANLRLRVVRAGQSVLDAPVKFTDCEEPYCRPVSLIAAAGQSPPAVRVLDLDGDGEPEVLLSVFTGGAHCCTTVRVYRLAGATYAHTDIELGNGSVQPLDLGRDGLIELVGDDDRFAYAFTSYAGSGRPVLIRRVVAGRVSDVTRRFPAQLRADARTWMRVIRERCAPPISEDADTFGVWAPWAADQYRLGRRAQALQVLRAQARAGCVAGSGDATAYIGRLDRFLRTIGG